MEKKDYQVCIEANVGLIEAFDKILQINCWWPGEVSGQSQYLNDEFVLTYADQHYSKQKVVEVVPNEKIIWLVTDSKLNWAENKTEWTGTRLVFELAHNGEQTTITFIHEGLVPGMESFEPCSDGWDSLIKGNLFDFLTIGKLTEKAKADL